jgi:hypothetical protein
VRVCGSHVVWMLLKGAGILRLQEVRSRRFESVRGRFLWLTRSGRGLTLGFPPRLVPWAEEGSVLRSNRVAGHTIAGQVLSARGGWVGSGARRKDAR